MSRFKRFIPFAGFAWVMVYFAFHAFTGEQGIPNLRIYQQREQMLSQRLEQLQRCRADYEQRIAMLGDDNLDLDYLEERAHDVIYYADSKDIVLAYAVDAKAETANSASSFCTY
jgi:cell division protein FtsB